MAIIEVISSKANLKTIIKYVTQDKKTDEKLITGKDCLAESSLEEMLYTKNLYNKNSGRQYIHIIQSFNPKDNLSKEQVHNAGLKLAEKFNGFQVLIATHIDKEHLHNHLIINSVSFENGNKIQMSKKDLQKIKDYSDEICLAIGASVIPKKENTNYIKRNEYIVAERGESWKFKLMNAIDLSLAESNTKQEFIKQMNKLGYQVNWTNTRKYITYTTPEGYKCRDNKLYDEKYLKGEMENEFNGRIKTKESINNTNTSTNANTNEGRIYNNKSRFMVNNSSMDTEYTRQNKKYGIQNGQFTFNEFNNSKYGEGFKGYSRNSNQETNGGVSREIKESRENKMETNYAGSSNRTDSRNCARYTCNTTLETLITLSSLLETRNQNYDRPRRTIRSFRSLSKQAKKEWMYKHRNASSFNWDEEEEM